MKFGSAFQRLLWETFQAEPKWGTLFIMKGYVSNSFYQICLWAQCLARLGLFMPLDIRYVESLIAPPLVDTMEWVESPPFFTDLSETAVDLGNASS